MIIGIKKNYSELLIKITTCILIVYLFINSNFENNNLMFSIRKNSYDLKLINIINYFWLLINDNDSDTDCSSFVCVCPDLGVLKLNWPCISGVVCIVLQLVNSVCALMQYLTRLLAFIDGDLGIYADVWVCSCSDCCSDDLTLYPPHSPNSVVLLQLRSRRF